MFVVSSRVATVFLLAPHPPELAQLQLPADPPHVTLMGEEEKPSCHPLFVVPFTHAWTSEATLNANVPLAPGASPPAVVVAVWTTEVTAGTEVSLGPAQLPPAVLSVQLAPMRDSVIVPPFWQVLQPVWWKVSVALVMVAQVGRAGMAKRRFIRRSRLPPVALH